MTVFCVCRDSPAYAVKFEPDGDLLQILAPTHKPIRSPYKLFYQVLGIPVTELEHKKQFKLLFYTPEDQGKINRNNFVRIVGQRSVN